jgi:hypothetical protein
MHKARERRGRERDKKDRYIYMIVDVIKIIYMKRKKKFLYSSFFCGNVEGT